VDGARFVPASVRVTSLEEGSVEAVVRGEPRDDSRHAPRIVVKAVTYHQLFFGRRGGRWEAEVFLDI
jgi:SHS2 domain-containing protein